MSKYDNKSKYTYARFIEFQQKYYWSSQPSYIRNHALYDIWVQWQGKYYYDDTNYARATSVSWDITKNDFAYEYSGVTSDYNALRVYGQPWSSKAEFIYTGTFDGVTLGTINRESGNKSRTDYARVRCVRKQ